MGALLLVAALLLAVPVLVLAIQVSSALLARKTEPGTQAMSARPASVAVLVPAHDEAAGIAATIASVLAQLSGADRLLVVADNCSDDTARIARAAGADVIERHDELHRGKGYALDCGVKHLAESPPEAVVIVDADCIPAAGAIDRIARLSVMTRRPVQALYLMHSPPGAPLKTRIAEFAWVFKTQRIIGFHHLGLPCQLMGSGMAFPWQLINKAPLASGHIVEDLQLGLDLTIAGAPPLFCPQALVTSMFPLGASGMASQRMRWEHGHFGVIASMGPRLVRLAWTRRQSELAAMALDVCVPPLAALVMALSLVMLASAAAALAGTANFALLVSALSMATLAAILAIAWRAFGKEVVTLAELATAPAYVIAKIPMYLRMGWKRQTQWVRTKRDHGAD